MVKIIILDDNNEYCLQLYNYLACFDDIKVYMSYDIDEAYHMINIISPQIVITDMVLGNSNVFSLFNRLELPNQTTKYIVLSASKNNSLVKKCSNFGITEYMLKPVEHDVLMTCIRKITDFEHLGQDKKEPNIVFDFSNNHQYLERVVELMIKERQSLNSAYAKTAKDFFTTALNVKRVIKEICHMDDEFIYTLVERYRDA